MTLTADFSVIPDTQRGAEVGRLCDAMEAADKAGYYPRLTVERPWSAHNRVLEGANRNWELHLAVVEDRLAVSRTLAVDMESATVAASGFRYRIPTATLLAVSDKPRHAPRARLGR